MTSVRGSSWDKQEYWFGRNSLDTFGIETDVWGFIVRSIRLSQSCREYLY